MLTVDAAVVQKGPVFVVVGDVGEKKKNNNKKIAKIKRKLNVKKIFLEMLVTKSKEPTSAPPQKKRSTLYRGIVKIIRKLRFKDFFAQKGFI